MIEAESHVEAAAFVHHLLDGIPGVHRPPIPTSVVAGPAVLIQTPQANEVRTLAGTGCTWAYEISVLVVAGNTMGAGLLPLVDQVCTALADAGMRVSTSPQVYQVPNTPAGIPAVLVKGA